MTGPHVVTDLMDQNFSSLKELALLVLGVSVGGFGSSFSVSSFRSRFGFSNLFSGGLFDYLFRSLLCNRSVLGWSILGRSLFSRCRLRRSEERRVGKECGWRRERGLGGE